MLLSQSPVATAWLSHTSIQVCLVPKLGLLNICFPMYGPLREFSNIREVRGRGIERETHLITALVSDSPEYNCTRCWNTVTFLDFLIFTLGEKIVSFAELIGTAGILQLVLREFWRHLQRRGEKSNWIHTLSFCWKSAIPITGLVLELCIPEHGQGVSSVSLNTTPVRELTSPEPWPFHSCLDLTIWKFSLFNLESVFLCHLSIECKPSLWAHNKQLTFPVHFKCSKLSNLPWVFSLEDLVPSLAHCLPWLLFSHCIVLLP